ncbi:Cacna1h, partial [Symbiodinium pilosum]
AMVPQQCKRCWRLWMNTCDQVLIKLGREPDLEICSHLQRRHYREGQCTCNCGKCQRFLSR